MTKSLPVFAFLACLALPLLSGCTKAADPTPQMAAPAAVTAPDKPATPDVVHSNAPAAISSQSEGQPSATVSASVSANGTEARAGDVSVKLPD
jgi:hypothetical protein